MEYVVLHDIRVVGNRCVYNCTIPGKLAHYVEDIKAPLFVELPEGYNLEEVPEALLTVPFVGSMMCATMLMNIGIVVPQLDKTFYNSIPEITNAYRKMFPYADFCFDVQAEQLVDCSYEPQAKPTVFFTGGVDATSALVEHIDDTSYMVNIFGGDVLHTDVKSHEDLQRYLDELKETTNVGYTFIKTNCRRYFKERNIEIEILDHILKRENNHGWWASIAHILAMTTAMAPFAYLNKIPKNYIGSSYEIGNTLDANNIAMVGGVKYASMRFEVVDQNVGRTEKIEKIINYCKNNSNVKFEFKVCWYVIAGKNCSHCEKCYRTILNILTAHGNPNDFGFSIDDAGYKGMRRFLYTHYVDPVIWGDILRKFHDEADFWNNNQQISWILNVKLNNPIRIKVFQKYCRLKNILSRLRSKLLGEINFKN